jgi:nucleoside-diphosphate-sugar epimerase
MIIGSIARSARFDQTRNPQDKDEMQKILLLGAGGFIGSHLAVELMNSKQYQITALDITKEKLDEGIRLAAELYLRDAAGGDEVSDDDIDKVMEPIRYVHLDIMEESRRQELRDLVGSHDIVVNMVAICNPALYVSDPIATFEVGFLGNLMVCDMCLELGKRLVQFSTSEVYGKSPSVYVPDQPFVFNEETSNLIMGPINKHRWIYASGKQLLERVIHAYGMKRDFHYSVVRPFNYIGERIDYLPSQQNGNPRVFSHFMDALLQGTPLKLVNGGRQQRCYTYIKDATEAHVRIIANADNACDQQIFNVGTNDNETTIENLAVQMREIYREHFLQDGQPLSEIVTVDGDEFYGGGYDDIDRRLLDNSKVRELTGWKPETDLETMLYKIMVYYVEKVRNGQGAGVPD